MMPRLSQRSSVSRTKQVVTMIVTVLAILGGLFVATQMFARTFGFNSALGENLGGFICPGKSSVGTSNGVMCIKSIS